MWIKFFFLCQFHKLFSHKPKSEKKQKIFVIKSSSFNKSLNVFLSPAKAHLCRVMKEWKTFFFYSQHHKNFLFSFFSLIGPLFSSSIEYFHSKQLFSSLSQFLVYLTATAMNSYFLIPWREKKIKQYQNQSIWRPFH